MSNHGSEEVATGTGKNAEQAINSFKTNYDDMKRYYAEENKEFEEVEFSYEYDMASFLSYYCKAFSLASLCPCVLTMYWLCCIFNSLELLGIKIGIVQ